MWISRPLFVLPLTSPRVNKRKLPLTNPVVRIHRVEPNGKNTFVHFHPRPKFKTLVGREYTAPPMEHSPTSVASQDLIVVFHGFSSCPGTIEPLINMALQHNMDIMVPLLPGHGFKAGECVTNEASRHIPNRCAGNERSDESMPTSRQGYVDWVGMVNDMVIDEVCRHGYQRVHTVGLSMGATLVSYAINTAPPGMYSRLFTINPIFGASYPACDKAFMACQLAGNDNCVTKVLANVVNGAVGGSEETAELMAGKLDFTFDQMAGLLTAFMGDQVKLFSDLSDEEKYIGLNYLARRMMYTLGEKPNELWPVLKIALENAVVENEAECFDSQSLGRGGYCMGRLQTILSMHSFGQMALRTLGKATSSQPTGGSPLKRIP